MTTSTSSSSRNSNFVVTVGALFVLFLSGGDHDVQALITSRATRIVNPSATTSLRLASEVVVPSTTSSSSKSSSDSGKSSSSSTRTIDEFVKPPRLIPEDPLLMPTLYNYDHCPFCVRVRIALGFKNIKHNIVFMANDDVATPTAMVGKKIAPIMVSVVVVTCGSARLTLRIASHRIASHRLAAF